MSNQQSSIAKSSIAKILAGGGESKSDEILRDPLPPPLSAGVSDEAVKNICAKIAAFRFIPSLRLKLKDTEAGKLVKLTYAMQVVGVTKIACNKIRMYFKELNMDTESERIFDLVDSHVCTNGTIMSALNRMYNTLPIKEPGYKYTDVIKQFINYIFPRKIIEEKIETPDWNNADIFDIVKASDAGLPAMAYRNNAKSGDTEVMKAAIELAEKYIPLFSDVRAFDGKLKGNLLDYMVNHPIEFTYLLKRKFERVKRSEWENKARPYFVAPLALKLLFKWVSYYMRQQNVLFDDSALSEDRWSASAYTFCWSGGGAGKIMAWIERVAKTAVTMKSFIFRFITFGDDQLWVFADPNGHVYLYGPDIKAMDSTINSESSKCEIDNHISAFKNKPSVCYRNVSKLLAYHSTNIPVLIHGSVVVQKRYGENSGLIATTQIDMNQSGHIGYHVNQHIVAINKRYKESANKEVFIKHFKQHLDVIPELVLSTTGCIIKPETMVCQEADPLVVGPDGPYDLDIPFLGYKIMYNQYIEAYTPYPLDMDKCWVSLCLPSRTVESKKQISNLMERIYGLNLSGYSANHHFYELSSQLFLFLAQQGAKMFKPDVTTDIVSTHQLESLISNYPQPLSPRQTIVFYAYGLQALKDPKYLQYITDVPEMLSPTVGAENIMSDLKDLYSSGLIDVPIAEIPFSKVGKLVGKKKYVPKIKTNSSSFATGRVANKREFRARQHEDFDPSEELQRELLQQAEDDVKNVPSARNVGVSWGDFAVDEYEEPDEDLTFDKAQEELRELQRKYDKYLIIDGMDEAEMDPQADNNGEVFKIVTNANPRRRPLRVSKR